MQAEEQRLRMQSLVVLPLLVGASLLVCALAQGSDEIIKPSQLPTEVHRSLHAIRPLGVAAGYGPGRVGVTPHPLGKVGVRMAGKRMAGKRMAGKRMAGKAVGRKYVPKKIVVGAQLGWTFFVGQMWKPTQTLFVGDRLVFNGAGHTVYQFRNAQAFQGCKFSHALNLGKVDGTLVLPPFTRPGVYYYGCNILSHCYSNGQKLTVVVRPAPV